MVRKPIRTRKKKQQRGTIILIFDDSAEHTLRNNRKYWMGRLIKARARRRQYNQHCHTKNTRIEKRALCHPFNFRETKFIQMCDNNGPYWSKIPKQLNNLTKWMVFAHTLFWYCYWCRYSSSSIGCCCCFFLLLLMLMLNAKPYPGHFLVPIT